MENTGAPLDNRREKFPIFPAWGFLPLGFGIILALNWPGQMSYDSVVQLADGRSGHYDSWHPPVMAWLLGLFDSVLPGPGIFLAFVMSLLFGAWFLLLRGGRPGWGMAILLILIFSTPQLVLYQGTIWKDVLFANAGIAAFACLATAATQWRARRSRFFWLFLSAMCLSLAALARQNGFLLPPVAAVCLGMIASRTDSARAGWRHGAGLLMASVLMIVLANFALSFKSDGGEGAAQQLRLAQAYDLVGAVHLDPSIRLNVLERRAPNLDAAIRTDGVTLYSPRLVDTLETSDRLTNAIYGAPPGVVFAQWRQLIAFHSGLYLRERLPVFRWVVAPPDIFVCHPDVVGVDGPPEMLKALGLKAHIRPQDVFLYSYVAHFFYTPVLSHLFYGVLALLFLGLLMRRGTPSDIAMAGLQAAALIFALSFFLISIACDYRYLYFLDLAAMTGALQLLRGRQIPH
jgi:hypothetical protein